MNYSANNSKDWWAPLWRGLVVDPDAKHYRRMKSALWLFVYLVVHADRQNGSLKRKLKTISVDTGIKARTIRGWLRCLRSSGYIETKNTGRCLVIMVVKWKGSEWKNRDTQTGQFQPARSSESRPSERELSGANSQPLSQNLQVSFRHNDISIKRLLLQNDREDESISDRYSQEATAFRPKDRAGQLALDLAQGLNDVKGLPLYVFYGRKYPEFFLRTTLGVVKEIPREKIKKSRAALFNYLVQQYAKNGT
jgi:hypothetical protein